MRYRLQFRAVEKEGLEFQVPILIAGLVRERAARERRSLSEVGTELLAQSLGVDPSQYGIGVKVASRA